MKSRISRGALGILLAATSLVGAFAHDGATGIVGERMGGMMMLGDQMKLLNGHFGGSQSLPDKQLAMIGSMIESHSGEAMLSLFPEGSIDGPSEALPVIWSNWEEFEELATRLASLASEFVEVVDKPDPKPEEPQEKPQLSEWERLDTDLLLGLKNWDERQAEILALAQPQLDRVSAQVTRPLNRIYRDIADTCSSCHSNFRR